MNDTNEIPHLERLISQHKKNLRILELQAARYGINVPVNLINEIDDERKNLSELEKQLQSEKQAKDAFEDISDVNIKNSPCIPKGTVTFLFTDIENILSLWEQEQDTLMAGLIRHDLLLKEAILANDGYIFRSSGNAFCAAFDHPHKALVAALTAQRSLQDEAWGEVGPMRVRMAVHTGVVELGAGNYFGPSLNRTSSILAIGHGGQILLSHITQELFRDFLPTGSTIRDLGNHLLKDLQPAEHIYQLIAQGLPTDFPPLQTVTNYFTNLPLQPNSIVDREEEAAEIEKNLRRADVQLLTLTGPGGTGKTRLALQVAANILHEFDNGVFFISLAPLKDPKLVASTIAQILGVREEGARSLKEIIKEYLIDKQVLLLLDNFEQVVEAAILIAELISVCPRLKVLVTSRAALHLQCEHEFPVSPLKLPNPNHLPDIEALPQYAAVELFIQRALAIKPDFQVTNANAPAVAGICVRLDGLPLAIELAAARIKLLPPQAILTRLHKRIGLLTGGARDLPERQRTLRNTIAWSYDLLNVSEQNLFRRLSVFVGGFTFEAVELVCNPANELMIDVLDGITSLNDKNLLQQQKEQSNAEPRFVMLETIREYGFELMITSEDAKKIRRNHALFFIKIVEESESELGGPQQAAWLDRLEAERDNLRAALQWMEESNEIETGLRICGILYRYWYVRGYISEGLEWLTRFLTLAGSEGQTLDRAKALNAAGVLAYFQGDYELAKVNHEEGLAIRKMFADKRGIANSLVNLGDVIHKQENLVLATSLYEDSLLIRQELGDKLGIAAALNRLGMIAYDQGKHDKARSLYEKSLLLRRELGARRGISNCLNNLGMIACKQGQFIEAHSLFTESLEIRQELGDKRGIADSYKNLGIVAYNQGDLNKAARFFGAADTIRKSIGTPLSPSEQADHERYIVDVRAKLGKSIFDLEWSKGVSMQP